MGSVKYPSNTCSIAMVTNTRADAVSIVKRHPKNVSVVTIVRTADLDGATIARATIYMTG